ncbi:hypothetical protein Tco_1451282 [Tanacetum coccineum]
MDKDLRESYRTLENRLFHEGRFVTPSFIEANNMIPTFQAVDLESFLTLDEPICPRFEIKNKSNAPMLFSMLLTRLYKYLLQTNPQSIVPLARFMFHERVMNPLYISWNPIKEKGKRVALSSSSSSSSSSDENEVASFLEFYEELSDNEDLTDAQKEKRGMFKCLNRYFGTISMYLKNKK